MSPGPQFLSLHNGRKQSPDSPGTGDSTIGEVKHVRERVSQPQAMSVFLLPEFGHTLPLSLKSSFLFTTKLVW